MEVTVKQLETLKLEAFQKGIAEGEGFGYSQAEIEMAKLREEVKLLRIQLQDSRYQAWGIPVAYEQIG